MANVVSFPRSVAARAPAAPARAPARASGSAADFPSPLPHTAGRRCEYAVGDLARLLGLGHFAPRTIIAYLRALAADEGMPLPKTPRLHGGTLVHGVAAIGRHSRWDAELFDGWHARRGRGRTEDAPPAPPALHAELADRARRLAGVVQL